MQRVKTTDGWERAWNAARLTPRQRIFAVAAAALGLAGAVAAWGWRTHRLLLYGDATAHLMIARRMLDSSTPGLAQWGSVWLPFPHLLMAPWAQYNALWRTGLAGSLVAMAAFCVATVFFYRLAARHAGPLIAGCAALIFLLNPNLLYLAAVPMTETVYLACFLGTLDQLSAWTQSPQTRRYRHAWLAGAWALGGALTRYDGWFILPFCAAVLALSAWPEWRRSWGACWRFCLLAGAGPIFWFAYNAYYFGDWLNFARGPYSARQIYLRALRHGGQRYPGDHELLTATAYFFKAVELDCGLVLLVAGLAGLLFWLRRRGHEVVPLLLWLPLPWYIWAMWTGNVPIFVPMYWPHGYYNLRYGVQLLPALALFAAWLGVEIHHHLAARQNPPAGARRGLAWGLALAALILIGDLGMFRGRGPMVYAEAAYNSTGRLAMEHQLAAALRRVRPGQKILMYIGTFPGALADDGIDLRRVVNESNFQLWRAALAAPQKFAAWVVDEKNTWLAQAVNRRALAQHFTPVARLRVAGQHPITIYRRRGIR